MRVTTWNCCGGIDADGCAELLAPLGADLVAIQECRRPDVESTSVIWRGTDPNRGVAVVSAQRALRLEPIDIPSLHPTVVPVVVHSPKPFMFVGVWTHLNYNKVAWEAMSACAAAADGRPMVAAGDFNSSPGVTGQERTSLQFLNRMRNDLGLVSAYHHLYGEDPGVETLATHFFRRRESAPFHIDYCFVPECWLDRLAGVEIGSFEDWTKSDHRPLTVDIKDSIDV